MILLLTYIFWLVVLMVIWWAIGYWFGGNPIAGYAQKLVLFIAIIVVLIAVYALLTGGFSLAPPNGRLL